METLGELMCHAKGHGGLLYIGKPFKSLNSIRATIRFVLQVSHPAKLSAVFTTTESHA